MTCSISCAISCIFIIGMIYFYNATGKSDIVNQYKDTLPPDLQQRYEKITEERKRISYQGYLLGVVLSLILIYRVKLRNISLVCTVMTTCFLTQYFYYILSPKSDWMLNHTTHQDQVHAWLIMYRHMSYHYHLGIVFGILAVGMFAFAFRC
jgi:esterase/lipase